MGGIPLITKTWFTRDVIAAGHAIDSGVVAKTTWTRQKYWKKWCNYAASLQVDLLLQTTDPLIQDIVTIAFAARVRTGYYGLGTCVKVQGVSDALAAISKTIELVGLRSPLYRAPNKYTLALERCLEGMHHEDPPAVPQLALPVSVLLDLVQRAYDTEDP